MITHTHHFLSLKSFFRVFDCALRQKKRANEEVEKPKEGDEDDEDTFKIKSGGEGGGGKKPKKLRIPKAASVSAFREPTAEDIKKAKDMMPVIRPSEAPLCQCGIKTNARKNRKEGSPGFGMMFWWCGKGKHDETRCNFSRKADII